jgi:hypothetical protein
MALLLMPMSLAAASAPLTITTTSCPRGKQNTAYAGCTLAATGGTPPYTWSVLTGAEGFAAGTSTLPEGLTIIGNTIVGATIGGQASVHNHQPTLTVTPSVANQLP